MFRTASFFVSPYARDPGKAGQKARYPPFSFNKTTVYLYAFMASPPMEFRFLLRRPVNERGGPDTFGSRTETIPPQVEGSRGNRTADEQG